MDHFEHHLAKLRGAILSGNRSSASALAGDLADIFAALKHDDSPALYHLGSTVSAYQAAAALPLGHSGDFQAQVVR